MECRVALFYPSYWTWRGRPDLESFLLVLVVGKTSDQEVNSRSILRCSDTNRGLHRLLHDGREDLRLLAFGGIAVRVDEEVVIAVVRNLEWCSRFDVDELASCDVVPFRRIVDIHRQDPAENDKGLLLLQMAMTTAVRARLVAPNIATRVLEIRKLAELGNMARRFAGLARPSDPLPVATTNNAEAHERRF